jgi:hypothetical protein
VHQLLPDQLPRLKPRRKRRRKLLSLLLRKSQNLLPLKKKRETSDWIFSADLNLDYTLISPIRIQGKSSFASPFPFSPDFHAAMIEARRRG